MSTCYVFEKWIKSASSVMMCWYKKQNNTWLFSDTEFCFYYSTRYNISYSFAVLNNEILIEHSEINSISPRAHVLFSIYFDKKSRRSSTLPWPWDQGRDPFNQNSNRSDREKRTTSKGGPVFSKLFRLDRTDPLSFGPKFPEILVEWIAPQTYSHRFVSSVSVLTA